LSPKNKITTGAESEVVSARAIASLLASGGHALAGRICATTARP
jgi:hypothetical protein